MRYVAAVAAKSDKDQRGAAINRALSREYPDAECALRHADPFQLLIATILSAQCTDERVNMVTPALFRRFPTPAAMAAADPAELEDLIRTTGFFRNKAKSLLGMSRALVEHHGGKVPATMEELTKLPGVGRKTANVVLGNCFGVPGITVDTHVQRLSQRWGLTRETIPEKIERDLMKCIPEKEWTTFSHRTILHGRRVCQARKPLCDRCILTQWCVHYKQLQGREASATRRRKP